MLGSINDSTWQLVLNNCLDWSDYYSTHEKFMKIGPCKKSIVTINFEMPYLNN